ncbi:MAG: hypothetical protein JHD35_23525 [Sphingopyxis sp.]|nr:hypothetical protein [Sphingopyxis sp.]
MNYSIPDENGQIVLSLGIGCIFFAPEESLYKNPKEYYDIVLKTLSKIENVSEIKITGDDEKFGTARVHHCGDEPIACIHTYNAEIEFKVFISKKKQEEIGFWCGCETLIVHIVNEYYSPVTYIYAYQFDNNFIPSTSIALVREYFVEKLAGTAVKLCCVGPSPFHANFLLRNKQPKTEMKDVSEGRGYRGYLFNTQGNENPYYLFIEKYGHVFSVFYDLKNMRSRCIDLQTSILNDTKILSSKIRNRNFINRTKNFFTAKYIIDDANDSIMDEKICRSSIEAQMNENLLDTTSTQEFDTFKYHFSEIDRFVKDDSHLASIEVLRSIENRRHSFFQNISVFASAIFGGAIGSIITVALTAK